jgi:VanZ family protein
VARAALLALGVAALDEGLQARRPARTGSPLDVALDLAGAGLGIALAQRSRRARTVG